MSGIFLNLVSKDLKCLFRSRLGIVSTAALSLLLIIVSSFAFRQIGFGPEEIKSVTPGILTLVLIFIATVALNHCYIWEQNNLALIGLLVSAKNTSAFFFSKLFTNLIFVMFLHILILIAHALFFGAEYFSLLPQLIGLSFLFLVGFVSLGTLLSAIAVSLKGREIVLPLILYPLIIPAIGAFVFLLKELLQIGQIDFGSFWFQMLVVFDLVALMMSWALFDYVVKD
jgi:heme exporter protein B